MDSAAPLKAGPGGPVLYVDITRRFASGFQLAARIDVEIAAGSILVLFGPSGAGKTSVLRQIAGLERPDAGAMRFGDDTWCDVARGEWKEPQRRRVGLVFQEPTLFPHLTVRENILYGRGSGALIKDSRPPSPSVEEIATLLGIADLGNRHPRELSGGEAQRVALARALAPDPRLLLLDEPFAALDMPTRARLRRDVRALLHRTLTPAVLVTHDRTEALAMGDAAVVMIDGRVRQSGPIAGVFSHPADADVAASLGVESVIPARVVSTLGGLFDVAVGSAILQVAERDPLAPGTDVYACIRAEDVTLGTQLSTHASARNHLAARVVSLTPEGPIDRVSLDCGFPLDALITRRSSEELALQIGSRVTAAIKATCVHLVARS